ncbi:hypothetical protein AWZ03_006042 [Drosophila navojoa]|uniref:Uncharacterized protein n=1 Tax=Drosophila navojoa TaxID=7232 RepID=A0A484BFR7_DRONA|nr:hypothetical protein AWZ03_006042 [Drosophila navojoa]
MKATFVCCILLAAAAAAAMHIIKCNTRQHWMIMKMGDNASRPEDEQANQTADKRRSNNELRQRQQQQQQQRQQQRQRTTLERYSLAQSEGKKCDRLQCAPNFNWASRDQGDQRRLDEPTGQQQSICAMDGAMAFG